MSLLVLSTIVIVSSFSAIITWTCSPIQCSLKLTLIGVLTILLAVNTWICSAQFGAIGNPSTLNERQRYQIVAVMKSSVTDTVVLLIHADGQISSCKFQNQVEVSVGSFCKVGRRTDGSYTLISY